MHKIGILVASLSFAACTANAADQALSGTWKYVKTAQYFGDVKTDPLVEFPYLQIVQNRMVLIPRCPVPITYTKTRYDYSGLFQMALKAGVDEKALGKYVKKHLDYDLANTKDVYKSQKQLAACNFEHNTVTTSGNKLIYINGGGAFQLYERVSKATKTSGAPAERKLSDLPYSSATFNQLCAPGMQVVKGVPQSTDQCAPVLYPTVAGKAATDPLARVVGSHDYRKLGGEDVPNDYNNPASHNLHPVFMEFAPMNAVRVVAVEDIEQGEDFKRGGMTGMYLSIKDGKVIDQITVECRLQPDYSCTDYQGKKLYQLADSGKFVKIK